MVFDAAFWATVALFLFIGVIVYLKVPGMITKALDNRIKSIEAELAEAERLRLEAKFLLEEYESKRQAAASEAESIVAAAREEAFRLTAEAKTSLEALIARRTKAVEDKIAQAESQAIWKDPGGRIASRDPTASDAASRSTSWSIGASVSTSP